MTWNDLIFRLQEIPENRRDEKAVFAVPDEAEGFGSLWGAWEIDDVDHSGMTASSEQLENEGIYVEAMGNTPIVITP